MKFERTPERTSIAIYAFIVLSATIIFVAFLNHIGLLFGMIKTLLKYLHPVIIGFVFAFLLNPIVRWFDNDVLPKVFKGKMKPKLKRTVSIFLTYLLVFLFIGLLLWIVIPQLITSLSGLIKQSPNFMKSINSIYNDILNNFKLFQSNETLSPEVSSFFNKIMDTINDLISKISVFLVSMISGLISGITGLVSSIVDIVLGFTISIYFLSGREKLFAQLKKAAYAFLPKNFVGIIQGIFIGTSKIFSRYIVGAIIDSLVVGILVFIFMAIASFFDPDWWKYAVLISVIIACTNVIPYFGPTIGNIPSMLLLLTVNPWFIPIFFVFISILQTIDGNIINPKIVGSNVGLPAFWVIFAIMIFGGMMGIVGMFIGVPLFAVIYTLLSDLINYLLMKKRMSIKTDDYDSKMNPLK